MKETQFTIKLNRKELSALAVFKPELQQILDDYDNNFNKFIDKLLILSGTIKFLSSFPTKNNLSKVRLLQNIIYDYFFLESTKHFISEFIFNNSDYCRFIGYLDSIYYSSYDIIEDVEFSNDDRQEFFADYLKKIYELSSKF